MTKWITYLQALAPTTYRFPRCSTMAAGAAIALLVALVQAPSALSARSMPDLTVSAVSDPPASIVVGTPFNITATTTNTARHPARDSLTRFYLSTDAARGPSDVALSGAIAVETAQEASPLADSLGCAHTRCRPRGWDIPPACLRRRHEARPRIQREQQLPRLGGHRLVRPSARAAEPRARTRPEPDPEPLPGPAPSGGSSPALIQADLDAGRIDYGTSLIYRAWSLFWDARLPLATTVPGRPVRTSACSPRSRLPCRASRPTSGLSSRGGSRARPTPPVRSDRRQPPPRRGRPRRRTRPSSVARPSRGSTWTTRTTTPTRVSGPGSARRTQTDAATVLDPVLTDLTGISQLFTNPEPAGMGRPVPDTLSPPTTVATGR